uniref:CF0 subunit II of ATP synthase n=1 Tax=Climaconeis cf. scalaris TaxID=2846828 RepID=A0A8F8SR84_9STRA|nr:CF0 subunit II of ATP synthase [Climaconeis cf. scalaris]QYB19113.1 CF0 subunit II of ATP synthase [Climaconeis cf. scalaris]
MINFSILISNSEVSGPGGIFDFNGTLPFITIQFILSAFILNTFLYGPLSLIIEERKEYILTYLNQASEILKDANTITEQYDQKLAYTRKKAQLEITNSQKIYKEMVETELNISQNFIDDLLDTIQKYFIIKKKVAFSKLDKFVQALSADIESKLSI